MAQFSRPWTAGELASLSGAVCEGDATRQVRSLASLDVAGPDALSFCSGGRWLAALPKTRAGVLLLSEGEAPEGVVVLRHPKPREAYARLLPSLYGSYWPAPGVHPSAVVHPSVSTEGVTIEALAVVAEGVVLGEGAWIQAHAYVGAGTVLGARCRLGPHAVVMEGCALGDDVQVHAGAVVGADGFGHVFTATGLVRVHQLGKVVLEDQVEIGANACVDRAALGETRIGRGSKLDNLVQVAHGVHIGESCVLAAFAGVSGGASLGNGVVMAGRSAVVDGIHVGDGAVFAGLASASKDVPAGRKLGGSPARRYREWLREFAALRQLPSALRRLDRLEKRLTKQESEE